MFGDGDQQVVTEATTEARAATCPGCGTASERVDSVPGPGQRYAKGVREGQPNATQVADRFHLLQNPGDDVHERMKRHPWPPALPAPGVSPPTAPPAPDTTPAVPAEPKVPSPDADPTSLAMPLGPGDQRRAVR